LKPKWACFKAGRWPGAKVARAVEASQFATTTKLSRAGHLCWVGPNAFSGSAQLPELDSARAQVGATTFSYDLQLSLGHSSRQGPAALVSWAPANFSDSSADGGRTNRRHRWAWNGLQERLPAPIPLASQALTDTTRRRLHRHRGARWPGKTLLAPWGPAVYPADTVLEPLLTLNGGAPVAYNKNLRCRLRPLVQSNAFSVSANLRGGQRQPRAIPVRGGIGHQRLRLHGTVSDRLRRPSSGGLAAIYFLTYRPASMCLGATPFTAASPGGEPPPVGTPMSVGLSGYLAPANSAVIPSISAGCGSTTTPTTAISEWMVR